MLLKISEFLVADAYFPPKPFVDKVRECHLQLITRLRDDAVLYYPFLGPKRQGCGRHKKFAPCVEVRNRSPEHFTTCACREQDDVDMKAVFGSSPGGVEPKS